MKKILFIIYVNLLICFKSNSQNCATAPQWCTDGNSLFGTEVLGGDASAPFPLTVQTYGLTRFVVYEDPTTAGAYNAGFLGVGFTTPPRHVTIATQGTGVITGTGLFGFPPSMVELLVAGGDGRPDTVQQVAEFRSTRGNSNSIGVRIRGARAGNVDADCAHINFDNFYQTSDDETGEFNLPRISADVHFVTKN